MRASVAMLVLVLAIPLAPMGEALAPLPFFPQNDAGSGRDAPDSRSSEIVVRAGIVYEGATNGLIDRRDWYAFHAAAGDAIEIRAHTSASLCLSLFDPEGDEMGVVCSHVGVTEVLGRTLHGSATSSGLHHIEVLAVVPQSYTFAIGVNAPAPGAVTLVEHDDAGSGRDAPGHLSSEIRVQPNVAHKGRLDGIVDDADWYAFSVELGDAIEVRTRTTGIHCYYLHDPTQAEVGSSCDQIGGSAVFERKIRTTAALAGTYYLRVSFADPQFYSFGIGLNGPAPVDDPLPEI